MNRKDRERTILQLGFRGIRYDEARRLLRYGTTLNRLAEAQCNGDWPADNGDRKVEPCSQCEGLWAPSVLLKGKRCPDCRTQQAAGAYVYTLSPALGAKATPVFQGDPRGCVFGITFEGSNDIVCLG